MTNSPKQNVWPGLPKKSRTYNKMSAFEILDQTEETCKLLIEVLFKFPSSVVRYIHNHDITYAISITCTMYVGMEIHSSVQHFETQIDVTDQMFLALIRTSYDNASTYISVSKKYLSNKNCITITLQIKYRASILHVILHNHTDSLNTHFMQLHLILC